MQQENQLYAYARKVDLVDYLESLGYRPEQVRNNDYWYYSPFRNENEPSFKVNRKLNVWYDHGIGKGGNLIEFGKLYYQCTMEEFLERLKTGNRHTFSFHNQHLNKNFKIDSPIEDKITISSCRQIADPELRQYLDQRNIPLLIANRVCSEVEYEVHGKRWLAIGFKNDCEGYELRSKYFKGGSSPKTITSIKNDPDRLSVFEGFFDFLSFQNELLSDKQLVHRLPKDQDSYLILNSLSFFEKSRSLMEQYQKINLFLDNDEAGRSMTVKANSWSKKYTDKSHLYEGYKDLNQYYAERRNNMKMGNGKDRYVI